MINSKIYVQIINKWNYELRVFLHQFLWSQNFLSQLFETILNQQKSIFLVKNKISFQESSII